VLAVQESVYLLNVRKLEEEVHALFDRGI